MLKSPDLKLVLPVEGWHQKGPDSQRALDPVVRRAFAAIAVQLEAT